MSRVSGVGNSRWKEMPELSLGVGAGAGWGREFPLTQPFPAIRLTLGLITCENDETPGS